MFWLQSALEHQVLDERDKAQRLQTELDVSEQVQKDFVKLSQTLQVTVALSSREERKLETGHMQLYDISYHKKTVCE